jgi:predicted SnoaL-like aldol condensation-catalyzing enzyme
MRPLRAGPPPADAPRAHDEIPPKGEEVQGAMGAEETKAVLRRWYDEMWSRKDPELVTELAGPTYVRHEPGGTRSVSATEYQEQLRGLMPHMDIRDLRYELVAEGDRVVAIGSWQLNDSKQTWVQCFRVEGGKLVETWLSGIAADTQW